MSIHIGSNASIPPTASALPAASSSAFVHGTKRSRESVDGTELDTRPFSIRDPFEPFARPKTFKPVCLLSRSQLPLAFLDTAQFGSRVFSAHIYILESGHQHGDDATVLLAQEDKENRLYAVERMKSRTYALCRLQEAVNVDDLLHCASSTLTTNDRAVKRRALDKVEKGEPWWARAAVQVPLASEKAADGPKLPTSMMQRVMEAPPQLGETYGPTTEEPVSAVGADDMELQPLDLANLPLSSEDVLHDLAKHYMEALYIERTSLAYFVKGPLSRARAAFTGQHNDLTPGQLVDFLRQSILTSTTLDKKYKEGLSELVKELPAEGLQSPSDVAKRKKRKKKWKIRRSKTGFFVSEEDYVERWWRAEDEPSSGDADTASRRRLTKIRARETFLQLILALEVLSLEAVPGFSSETGHEVLIGPGMQGEDSQLAESQAALETKTKRSKKKQDLAALLETLLDKLCIWHSLEGPSPTKVRDSSTAGAQEGNDALKSFCVEVIIPFYSARTPQHASLVNKKLGGPSAQTPRTRRKSTTLQKPGEPAVRQPPERKPRQPLARVSTDTLNRSKMRPPSLHRSATDSDALVQVKRESSETPSLSSIPFTKALEKSKAQRRPRLNPLERMSSKPRLIDLSAMSQASEAKLRRKAESDRAIKEAVEGIKKPNRALAIKEVADSTDQSFAKAIAKSSMPQHREKKAGAEIIARSSLQSTGTETSERTAVSATPSGHGRRTLGATPQKRAAGSASEAHRTLDIPSSASVVPSSSARIRAPPLGMTAFAIPQTGHRPRRADVGGGAAVEETPSRGFAKFMPKGLATQPGTAMFESPVATRAAAMVDMTPLRSQAVLKLPWTAIETAKRPSERRESFDATQKPRISHCDTTRSESVAAPSGHASLYSALGWDDDGYEELT